ncbi:helix-turn-helix transcriptional regulator [Kitasatospora kifunensis]|uniref:DNA-binding CsgD family transcriptional regulator n=1 Tax=Kitasatospora kifunensis TaxID=58351 RepID=A0A7W7VU99_KITKI|nr:LuxR C-terminal-related transcriptional regulator [Kitasatospora kifunensis]MBB4922439.1 DNA-binding CsgD family transcriptional regulator [Kitasatospora kifunensis]
MTGEATHHETAGPVLYQWLRANESRSLTEAAAALGLDAREVSAAWTELRALRLVRPGSSMGETDLVEPDTALLSLLRQKQNVLRSQCEELTSIVSATESLLDRYRPAGARLSEQVEVEVIVGSRNQQRVLRDFADLPRAQSHTLHADTVPSKMMSQALNSFLTEKSRMVRRGVAVRAIYPQGFNSARWQCKYLAEVQRVGVELRLAPQVPFSLVIGDLDVALLPPRSDQPEDALIVIRGASLVRTYAAIYEDYWLRSFPYLGPADSPGEAESDWLTEQHRTSLRLLANGLTDERIARSMGVSVRTVSRLVSEVTRHLGAHSRFQAGVLACARGLV